VWIIHIRQILSQKTLHMNQQPDFAQQNNNQKNK
jgi:hypothetical protein